MVDTHIAAALASLNEARNSISLAEGEMAELQKKADSLKSTGEQFDKVTAQLAAQNGALAASSAKLAAVEAAHASFAKLITG